MSELQDALDEVDSMLTDLGALSDDDLDIVEAWCNNTGLDIMRLRYKKVAEG